MRKRMAALLAAMAAALVLVFAPAAPAQAETVTNITSNTKGQVQITGSDAGATSTLYRVIEVDWDDQAGASKGFKWVDSVQDWVKSNYSSYIDNENGYVTDDFKGADVAEKFYDKLAAALKGSGGPSLPEAATVSGNGTTSQIEMGAYLVLTSGADYVYSPAVANLVPVYNEGARQWQFTTPLALNVKKEPNPTEKTHKDGTSTGQAGIGDTLEFKLYSKIPGYPTEAIHKKYVVGDKMGDTLDYKAGSVRVYGVTAGRADESTLLSVGTDYTLSESPDLVTAPDSVDKYLDFRIDFTEGFVENPSKSGKDFEQVLVTYEATLNDDAMPGTPNTNDGLTWWTDPYEGNWHKTDDRTEDYTFGIKINKVDDADQPLVGAKFSIFEQGSDNPIKFELRNGYWCKLENQQAANGETELPVSTSTGKDMGVLRVRGLAAGDYTVKETVPPSGYNIADPKDIIITALKDNGDYTGHVQDEVQGEIGYVSCKVVNKKGFTLPTTGGMGTAVFAAAGVVLVGGGVALYHTIRKREQR